MDVNLSVLNALLLLSTKARQARPISVAEATPVRQDASGCPFCKGFEVEKPLEISQGLKGSLAFSLGNLYPFGEQHELLIPSRNHHGHLHTLDLAAMQNFVGLLERRVELMRECNPTHVSVWLSYGAQAGASQDHPHVQVASFPVVPPGILAEPTGSECQLCKSKPFFSASGVSIHALESSYDGELIIASDAHTENLNSKAHALILLSALRTLQDVFSGAAYNVIWHTFSSLGRHPHIHLTPRLTTLSGVNLIEGWYECRTTGLKLATQAAPLMLEHYEELEEEALTIAPAQPLTLNPTE